MRDAGASYHEKAPAQHTQGPPGGSEAPGYSGVDGMRVTGHQRIDDPLVRVGWHRWRFEHLHHGDDQPADPGTDQNPQNADDGLRRQAYSAAEQVDHLVAKVRDQPSHQPATIRTLVRSFMPLKSWRTMSALFIPLHPWLQSDAKPCRSGIPDLRTPGIRGTAHACRCHKIRLQIVHACHGLAVGVRIWRKSMVSFLLQRIIAKTPRRMGRNPWR